MKPADPHETASVTKDLAAARAALVAGDVRGALESLLAAWRARRAADLAHAIEALDARITAAAPLIPGRTQQDRLVAWVELARRGAPADLGRLLVAYEDERANEHVRTIVPRLDELENRRDDPRPTEPLLRTLAMPGGASAWRKVFLRVCRCLVAGGDPRALTGLEERLQRERKGAPQRTPSNRGFIIERGERTLAELTSRFPEGPPALDDSAARALAEVVAVIHALPDELPLPALDSMSVPARDDIAALTRAVFAAPDDDQARLVLADALQERGDPRGELIMLQVARANGVADARSERRERALLKTNLKAWLGPLARVVKTSSAVFERGFLAECVAEVRNAATAQTELHHEEWATVRKVTFVRTALVTPAMRALIEASGMTDDALKRLAPSGHPRLEALEMVTSRAYGSYDDALERGSPRGGLKALAGCAALPALSRLRLRIGAREHHTNFGFYLRTAKDYAWLWSAPWGAQLRALAISADRQIEEILASWSATFCERGHLDQIHLLGSEQGVSLLRADRGVRVVLHPPWWKDGPAPPYAATWLLSMIRSLSRVRDLSVVRVPLRADQSLDPADEQRIRKVAALKGVTLELS